MDNQKTHIHHGIKFLFITVVLLITCANSFAQSESITDPNIQKTITVRHIDPNIAAKVIEQIIKLKIFQLPKETLVVPNQQGKMLTAMTETAGQMKLIEEIVENIDFQITNEGTINKIHIPVNNLIFDEFYRIISPLLSREGRLSYNITAHMLVVTEITENLKNIENFATKLDSYDFVDPNSIPDAGVIDIPKQADANSIEIKAADINEPMVAVQFSGFKIEQITERLKQWTGKEVIPSQEAMNIRLTVYSPEIMKRSEAIKLLYDAIRYQGFIAEETDNTIYIKTQPFPKDTVQLIEPNEPLENIPDKDIEVRKIFNLKNTSPSIMGQLINSYLSLSGFYFADDSTKTLVISDTVKNLIQIKQRIEIFDSDPNALPKGGVIYPVDPNEKAQRQESDAVYVKYVDADIGAEKLRELLKEIEIDLTNRLIILPLATSKQILVFGNNEKDRELAENLIHNIDYQAAENSYDFENIQLKYIEPVEFTNFVTNTIEEYKDLKLNLYPIVATKQILLFGGKEYRNVIRKFAEKIDFQTSRLGTEDPNSPSLTTASDIFLKIFEIQNWNSVELAEMLNAIIKNKINNDFTTNLEADPITLIPWPEKHWLIVKASEESIKYIAEWIKKLESEYPDKFQNISLSEIKDKNQIFTKIYNLEYSTLPEINEKIKPLLSDKGYLSTEDNTGTILVRDKASVLLEIEKIISIYDLLKNKDLQVSSEPLVAIQFSSLGITQIIKSLTEWTGKIVIPSEEANNLTIAVYAAEKMTRSNAAKLIYAAIRYQGFIVEETEDSIYIKNREDLLNSSSSDVTDFDRIQIIFADMDELIENILTILRGSNMNFTQNTAFIPLIGLKQILVSGDKKYRDIIKKVIATIDKPSFVDAQEYEFIPIKYVDFNELTSTMYSILDDSKIDYQNKISIVPLTELKTLIIYGNKDYCELIRKMVDVPSEQSQLIRKSFQLEYANPRDVQNKLNELFGDPNTHNNSNSRTISEDSVITTIYPSLNEIVILAPEDKMKEIEKIIMEWDSPIDFD